MKILLSLLFSIFIFCNTAVAEELKGRVVGVHDGDTLTILDSKTKTTKIRLAEIDTPESKQPFGSKAKQFLSELAFEKDATVDAQDIDRYGRTVGRVYIGSIDVNREIIQNGMGWVYVTYLKDKSLLADQKEAQAKKIGIWSLPESEQIPPWEWRKGKRADLNYPKSEAPKSNVFQLAAGCCKVCSKGKPCGDSCISQSKTCRKGPGCAC